jgi:hypothetical protein
VKQAYVFGLHNSNCKLDERNGNNKTVNIASHHRSDGRTDCPKWEMTTKSKTGRDKTSKHALEEDFFAFYFLLLLLLLMMMRTRTSFAASARRRRHGLPTPQCLQIDAHGTWLETGKSNAESRGGRN